MAISDPVVLKGKTFENCAPKKVFLLCVDASGWQPGAYISQQGRQSGTISLLCACFYALSPELDADLRIIKTQKNDSTMKIAVIGSGIAGLSCAWLLAKHGGDSKQLTLFEQNDYLGGHTNTIDVTVDGISHPVDTGFLVFNDWTYPNLIALFRHIGVEDAPSDMSFSVKLTNPAGISELEWSGSNLATVFAQPGNLFSPRFWGMLKDIMRFNREATALAAERASMPGTLGQYLAGNGYGENFRNWYLAPMAACIWSTPTQKIDDFPLATFLTFCHNHGLLSVSHRPQWRTVKGGARTYALKLAAELQDIRLNAGVTQVLRQGKNVLVRAAGQTESFDQVVFACHSDQTLKLLGDASEAELRVLAAIPYQPNTAILHTDQRLLPQRRQAWAAWNYHAPYIESGGAAVVESADGRRGVSLSYLINRLQPLPFKSPVIVTMNPLLAPRPETVIRTIAYDHPMFLAESIVAKRGLRTIQGERNTWFAGAWTRYGFHEDGLMSGIAVAKALGATVPWTTNVPAANDLATSYPGVDA